MATSRFFSGEFDDIVEVCWPTLIRSRSLVVSERGRAPFRQILFITGEALILQRSGKSAQAAALSIMTYT